MVEHDVNEMWEELKEVWKRSSQREKITIQVSNLIAELQSKVSQFERDSIRRDRIRIEEMTSQFEKDSITRDLRMITASIRKLIQKLKGEK